ncbi:Cyclin-dependent kinase inhibitor [Macleaya cordata]|uniref:Cyclin-dependent kinase inhibitor n=1 Tax=Macleaya cordata TaxID=56857 RepID=A0A200QZ91_MACCD|nr:Cyclin-dependent kinase inhibitor [Macleaya cordata]
MAELGHHVGVKTRARTLAMATASATNKRTKVARREMEFCSSYNQLENRRRLVITPDLPISPASSDNNSGSVVMSDRCSGNGSCELVSGSLMRSFVDLESEGFKFENSTNFFHRKDSDLNSESNDLESTARPSEANSRRRSLSAERMPSDAEIDDFFSAFEKDEQKRFSEKYNYDIVKDVPLEGRYDWIPLKP